MEFDKPHLVLVLGGGGANTKRCLGQSGRNSSFLHPLGLNLFGAHTCAGPCIGLDVECLIEKYWKRSKVLPAKPTVRKTHSTQFKHAWGSHCERGVPCIVGALAMVVSLAPVLDSQPLL